MFLTCSHLFPEALTPSGNKDGVVPAVPRTRFNDQGHKLACNNRHQPYPEHFQVKARTEATQHWGEKFDDLFLKDQVWAAREIWSTRVWAVKMTPFQEALLSCGLAKYTIPGDSMPDTVSVPIH